LFRGVFQFSDTPSKGAEFVESTGCCEGSRAGTGLAAPETTRQEREGNLVFLISIIEIQLGRITQP